MSQGSVCKSVLQGSCVLSESLTVSVCVYVTAVMFMSNLTSFCHMLSVCASRSSQICGLNIMSMHTLQKFLRYNKAGLGALILLQILASGGDPEAGHRCIGPKVADQLRLRSRPFWPAVGTFRKHRLDKHL